MFGLPMHKPMSNHPKYINPVSDFGFKFLFGSVSNKELLISLLNSIFRGRKIIRDLIFNKNEHVGDTDKIGGVVFDLSCTGGNGEKFVIEVQRSSHVNFKRRMLYYGCKLISDQAPKGKRHAWNYAISEVYVIVLLDSFSLSDAKSSGKWFHDICLCNRITGSVFYEDLGFIYIELVNFTKDVDDLKEDLDKWLYVLKHLTSMDEQPICLDKPIFEKLFNIAEYSRLSMEEKEMHDISLKRLWDAEAVRQYQEQRLEEAIERGLVQGVEQGRRELALETKLDLLEMAASMKKLGLSTDDIVKVTKLSVSEVEAL